MIILTILALIILIPLALFAGFWIVLFAYLGTLKAMDIVGRAILHLLPEENDMNGKELEMEKIRKTVNDSLKQEKRIEARERDRMMWAIIAMVVVGIAVGFS